MTGVDVAGTGVPGAVEMEIGLLVEDELERLYGLMAGVVERHEGFPQLPPLTREAFERSWTTGARALVAARAAGGLLGAYYLRENGPGRAAHVANAGYVVDPAHRRKGIGRALLADSLARAAALGFDAVQFNLVFASNPARALYEAFGFEAVGRIPGGVGPAGAAPAEDAIVYWRSLEGLGTAGGKRLGGSGASPGG